MPLPRSVLPACLAACLVAGPLHAQPAASAPASAPASGPGTWKLAVDPVSALALWTVQEPPLAAAVPVQRCVTSAVEFNHGLGLLALARPTDDQVRARLLTADLTPDERAQRQREFDAWQRGHRVADATQAHFADCVRGLPPVVTVATTKCFDLLMPSVMAEAYKSQGAKEEDVQTLLVDNFGKVVEPDFLKLSVHNVYVGDRLKDHYRAHRVSFAACLLQSRPSAP